MQALHAAISALGLQLFNFSFKWNEAEVCKCYSRPTHHALHMQGHVTFYTFFLQLQFESPEGLHGTLVEKFLNIRVPTEGQFTECLLASRLVRKQRRRQPLNRFMQLNSFCPSPTFRLEKYKYFKLEQLITNLKHDSTEDTDAGKTITVCKISDS